MEVEIKAELLSDAPWNEASKSLFTGTPNIMDDMVEDIIRDNPTCYLVSGYRGAGKTSFVLMLEDEIKKKEGLKPVLFVHTNFSKYHSQTHLLRKLIRGLYQKLQGTDPYCKDKNTTEGLSSEQVDKINDLYEKTFYDTTHNFTKSLRYENVTVGKLDVKAFLKCIIPFFFFAIFTFNAYTHFISADVLYNWLGLIITFVLTILGVFEINMTLTKNKTEQSDLIRKSLYDDEIADYFFIEILKCLKARYNIVFVLDELDKVEEKDMDNLLKEIKPYLVCGLATFIAVAGQHLYYQYENSRMKDDAILSSIFSKKVHISLLSSVELRELFVKQLVKQSNQYTSTQLNSLNEYTDYLIFQSKRIPRKFISMIREELIYINGKPVLVVPDSSGPYTIYSKIVSAIEVIDEQEITPQGYYDATHDYLVMQLFLKCHVIEFNKNTFLSIDQILEAQ